MNIIYDLPAPAAPAVPDPRPCADCGVTFGWDESPDDTRCACCADRHDWATGGAS